MRGGRVVRGMLDIVSDRRAHESTQHDQHRQEEQRNRRSEENRLHGNHDKSNLERMVTKYHGYGQRHLSRTITVPALQ